MFDVSVCHILCIYMHLCKLMDGHQRMSSIYLSQAQLGVAEQEIQIHQHFGEAGDKLHHQHTAQHHHLKMLGDYFILSSCYVIYICYNYGRNIQCQAAGLFLGTCHFMFQFSCHVPDDPSSPVLHGGTIKAMYVSPGETMDAKFSFHLSRPQLIP